MTEGQPFFDAEGVEFRNRCALCVASVLTYRAEGSGGQPSAIEPNARSSKTPKLPKTAKNGAERDAVRSSISELGDLAAGG